ncbi:GNAT family N-acetyltransferase [Zooshikella harenae]|uniref:GNAT family N-acetyltransferase n=1 Tax=Zooshikella harenae TaxID=2827238 RepID=A0ABS5ZB94_9GAMM|nr:GNAT family N-acetyltransferase [Zooshikella harenae]MBU2711338.1 GNAT family N-acetyltransferase [Zooshikella harenae]
MSNNNQPLIIRPATSDDVPTILNFIKNLAQYEKLSHEVVATEDKLKATLFGEHPAAEVIIAFLGDEPAGFALYFSSYSTFLAQPGMYLEDLYVNETLRGHGIGKALLRKLAQIAKSRHYGRLEWSVLNWNQPAINFYESIGAKPQDEWTVYRLTGTALNQLAE